MTARKLHVKDSQGRWLPVFCLQGGMIVTCERSPEKALPPHALWAADDLKYFSDHYANREFCLMVPEVQP